MWAAFGRIDDLPPLAFAMPAMFAKSSTIYNPIIYLMLRPNIRRVLCRDLGTLCQVCLKGCHCTKGPAECCSKPEIRVRLATIPRQSSQNPSSNSFAQPAIVALKDYSCEKCKDAFECFRNYPQICGVTNPAATEDAPKDPHTPDPQTHKQNIQRVYNKKCLLATMCAKRTPEIDNLHINLEMIPGHARVAWPWYSSQFLIILHFFAHIVIGDFMLSLNCQELFRNIPHAPTETCHCKPYVIWSKGVWVTVTGFPVFNGMFHKWWAFKDLFRWNSGRIQFKLELEVWEYYPGFQGLFQIVNILSLKSFFLWYIGCIIWACLISAANVKIVIWFAKFSNPQTKMQKFVTWK